MKKAIIFFLLMSWATGAFAQEHDNIWMLGYAGGSVSPGDTTFGISILDFEEGAGFTITNDQEREIDFSPTNAGIADEGGRLQFYFNGLFLEDAEGNIMMNGDSILPYDDWDVGHNLPQGAIALPRPAHPGQYVLFHEPDDFLEGIGLIGASLRYSVIDMSLNDGLGAVTTKDVLIVEDSLSWGQITAVKHANGQDWWLLAPRKNTNQYYRIRLNPEGVFNEGILAVGQPVRSALGQACFSPDGKWYVRFNTVSISEGQFIDIYDFDRCGGLLSNHRKIHYDENAASGGVAISSNSRYLYISSYLHVYQFDLRAEDIATTWDTVAIYDGYTDINGLGTRFFLAQLGPDGKIYLNCTNGVRELHVIHQPDKPGPACQVEQHGILLPTFNASSLPNFPNYRLGPIDGSPCDSLGIDNLPLARWRYGQDTLEPLQVAFTDLSAYEPAEWRWAFGDGSTSQDTSPVHVFEQDGLYEVCLTVSNANGSDTKCRELQLGLVSGVGQVQGLRFEVQVFPNPFGERFTVFLPEGWLPQQARLLLYDGLGRRVLSQRLRAGANEVAAGGLPAGVYFYVVEENGVVVAQGKILKR